MTQNRRERVVRRRHAAARLAWTLLLIGTADGARAITADTLAKPLAGDTIDVFAEEQQTYDDNLYRLPTGTTDVATIVGPGTAYQDHINTVSAGAVGQWEYSAQSVGIDLRLDDNRFSRNGGLDNTSGRGKAVWDWSLGSQWLLEGGAGLTRSLAGFANNKYFKRDLIDQTEYFANAQFQLGAHWLLTGGLREGHLTHSAELLRLDDAHTRTESFEIDYLTVAENKFGWEYDHIDGKLPGGAVLNGVPFDRDYKDNSASFLLHYAFAGKTVIVASSGYLKRSYASADVGSFSGPIWRATVTWQALEKTQFIFASSRQLTANIEAASDYFVLIGGGATLKWTPRDKIAVSLEASRFEQNYTGSNQVANPGLLRRDTLNDQQLAIEYTPRKYLDLKLSYGLEQRQSNEAVFQYDDKLLKIGLTGTF